MIIRMWRGRTPADKTDAYLEYLKQTGVAAYTAIDGNLGVQILHRVQGEVAEFLVVSRWESLDAIRAFAGDEYEKAVYYPEDADYLLEFSETVDHYDVLLDQTP